MVRQAIYLTPKGFDKIKEELRYLKEEKRDELAHNMGVALADGDLSESAAYDEARMMQSANEARIADLEEIVHHAQIVEAEEGADPSARLGASLELESASGERLRLHLVGTHEADILDDKISDESPLGQSLLGRRAGDDVQLPLGERVETYHVVSVAFD